MDTNSDSRAAFEQYIEKSQKKLVVFVVTQGHALNYGLGTYTANVYKSVGHNDNYDFVGIILDANSEDVKFDSIAFRIEVLARICSIKALRTFLHQD